MTTNIHVFNFTDEDATFLKTYLTKDIFVNEMCFEERNSVKPDILIGMDYFWDLLEKLEKIQLPSGLYLIHAKLGCLFSGKFENSFESLGYTIVNLDEKKFIETFLHLETIGIKDCPYVCDDDLASQKFNETIEYTNDRYQVTWPWKQKEVELPDNFGLAIGRLK